MNKVLDGLIGMKWLVYLDGVIIFGSSFEETFVNLKLVMAHLREHNLLAKARKWELFKMSIAFLGHIVSEKGIATENMQLICTKRPSGYEKHIGTWKLLHVFHQELLYINSHSTGTVEEVCPLQVIRRTRAGFH